MKSSVCSGSESESCCICISKLPDDSESSSGTTSLRRILTTLHIVVFTTAAIKPTNTGNNSVYFLGTINF